MSLKHRRVVTIADNATDVAAGKLCPSHWGSSSTNYTTSPVHTFDDGTHGSLLWRDTGSLEGYAWIPDVAVGSVLASGGVGATPAWTATPSLTSLTLSTPLPATSGGSGFGSYAIGDLLYASSTSALSKLADVAAGSVLASGGVNTAPAWSATPSLTSLTLSTPLAAGSGGTGQSSFTTGDLLYASGASALSKLASVAAGSFLRSGGAGAAPAWSTTTWPNSATTGDLVYASGSNAYGNLAAVASGQVLTSAGTGTAPAWSANPTLTSVVFSGGSVFEGSTANVIEQRNGTNAQSLRVHNTWSSSGTNYERGLFGYASNTFYIGTEKGGSGAARPIFFGTNPRGVPDAALSIQATQIDFYPNNLASWRMSTTGHFVNATHNTYDIGASASSTAPRNIFVGGAVCNRVKAGTPTDSDVTNPADGMLIGDTSGSKIWIRLSGSWKSVAVA